MNNKERLLVYCCVETSPTLSKRALHEEKCDIRETTTAALDLTASVDDCVPSPFPSCWLESSAAASAAARKAIDQTRTALASVGFYGISFEAPRTLSNQRGENERDYQSVYEGGAFANF